MGKADLFEPVIRLHVALSRSRRTESVGCLPGMTFVTATTDCATWWQSWWRLPAIACDRQASVHGVDQAAGSRERR